MLLEKIMNIMVEKKDDVSRQRLKSLNIERRRNEQ